MDNQRRLRFLQTVVLIWGIGLLVVLPMVVYFDLFHGWRWPPYNDIYDQMIVSIYVVLGVFLLRAVRHPDEHTSLLWFTVWSSVAHGLIMLYHAVSHPENTGHLIGDVNILVGAVILAIALKTTEKATVPRVS